MPNEVAPRCFHSGSIRWWLGGGLVIHKTQNISMQVGWFYVVSDTVRASESSFLRMAIKDFKRYVLLYLLKVKMGYKVACKCFLINDMPKGV